MMSSNESDLENFSLEDPCVFLPLEESVRLTDGQTIYRGEFSPSVDPPRPSAASVCVDVFHVKKLLFRNQLIGRGRCHHYR